MKRWTRWFYSTVSRSRLPVYFSVLVLFVIVLLIAPLYLTYTNKLKTEISQINASLLSQIQTGMDNLLKDIDRSSIKLSEDIGVKRFIFLEKNHLFSGEEDYQLFLKRIFEALSNEEKIYSNMTSIYLYINETHKVITSSETIDLNSFEDQRFVRSVLLNNEAPYRWTGKRETKMIRIQGYPSNQEVVTFYRNFSNDGMVIEATLFINVRIDLLKEYLRKFEGDYPMALQIIDANHSLIYGEMKNMRLGPEDLHRILQGSYDKDDLIRSEVSSKYSQWKYSVVIPKTWLFAPMKFISRMTLLLTIVVLLFGLLVSYYFTRRFYRPFDITLGDWRRRQGARKQGEPGGDDLHAAVKRLVHSTEKYGQVINDNRSMIRNSIVLELLKRNRWKETDIIDLNVHPKGNYYQVFSVCLDEPHDLNEDDKGLILFAAVNIAHETLDDVDCESEAALTNDSTFSVVLCKAAGAPPAAQRLHKPLKTLHQTCQPYLKSSGRLGGGNGYEGDQRVSLSFRESEMAVNHRIFREKGSIIYYRDLRVSANPSIHMDEWVKYKDMIMTGIRTRDAEKLERSIGLLSDWLLNNPGVKMNHIQYILCSILMDIEKMMYELNMDHKLVLSTDKPIFSLVDSCKTVIEIEKLLTDTCQAMVAYLQSNQYAVKSSLIASVVEFIETHYGQENLNLESLAERFNMNPSYLGQLMRKELNKTFLQTLSEIRIERSKELLIHSTLQIKDVAEQVGYVSRSTFIRVFKNYVGLTPSDYRNRFLGEAKS